MCWNWAMGTHPPRRATVARVAREALGGVGSGLVPLVVALWATGLRPGDLRLPLAGGDVLPLYSYARNMAKGNFYLWNPDLGFPYFQDGGQFPVTDLTGVAQLGVLANLLRDPVLAVNLFTFAGFAVVGVGTYLAFRLLGVRIRFAVPLAWCAALMPWHFARAGGHVFLSYYLAVPLALLLVGAIAAGATARRSWWALVGYLLCALAVGWGGIYYAVMACFLILAALVGRVLRFGWSAIADWRTLVIAATVPAAVVFAIALNYWSVSTQAIAEPVGRTAAESLAYGGNLTSLLLPAPMTLTGSLLPEQLQIAYSENVAGYSLAGVLAVLLTGWFVVTRFADRRALDPRSAAGSVHYWPGMFLVVLAFFITGGFGYLFAALVFPEIRAWGRFSVYLGLIAFLVCGLAFTAWSRQRGFARVAAHVGAAGLALLAVGDLIGGTVARSAEVAPAQALDAELSDYVAQLEADLADRCPILELPLTVYPEGLPVGAMGLYAHLWPYIYSDDLRWSFGGVKGTKEGNWGLDLVDDPNRLVQAARQAGFCGVQLDLAGLTPEQVASYEQLLGGSDMTSSSGRWRYFDLSR